MRTIALIMLALVLPIHGQEKGSQSTPSQNKAANVQQPKTPSPPIVPINQDASTRQSEGAKNHPESYLSRLFSPENLPNIGLCIAGVAGIIVAVCTLKAIQNQVQQMIESGKQTEALIEHASKQVDGLKAVAAASQANSEAALLNAKAIKSAERAHVDAEFARSSTHYVLTAINLGKSPAIIISYEFGRHSYSSDLKQIPDDLGDRRLFERHVFNQMLPVSQKQTVFEFEIPHYLTEEEQAGSRTALYRGLLRYQDIFGDEHETEVVYRYDGDQRGRRNIPRFNRYT